MTYTVNYVLWDTEQDDEVWRRVKLTIVSIGFETSISRLKEGWNLNDVKAEFMTKLQKFLAERSQRKGSFEVTV